DSPVPRRLALVHYSAGQFEDVDLRGLRRFQLSIADATGRPVAGAHVGVGGADGYLGCWNTRFVTDREGHAGLLVDDRFDCVVDGTTTPASAGQVIAKADPAGPLTLKLEALATLRLRVVGSNGQPVRGARLRWTNGGGSGNSVDAVGKGLDAVASSLN